MLDPCLAPEDFQPFASGTSLDRFEPRRQAPEFGILAWERLQRLLDCLPDVPLWVVADRRYTSHAFRQHIWDMGSRPAIPPQRHEVPVACPEWTYHNRNKVERLWAKLKEWRAVATRYEKTASSFLGVLCIAAAIDWLKR